MRRRTSRASFFLGREVTRRYATTRPPEPRARATSVSMVSFVGRQVDHYAVEITTSTEPAGSGICRSHLSRNPFVHRRRWRVAGCASASISSACRARRRGAPAGPSAWPRGSRRCRRPSRGRAPSPRAGQPSHAVRPARRAGPAPTWAAAALLGVVERVPNLAASLRRRATGTAPTTAALGYCPRGLGVQRRRPLLAQLISRRRHRSTSFQVRNCRGASQRRARSTRNTLIFAALLVGPANRRPSASFGDTDRRLRQAERFMLQMGTRIPARCSSRPVDIRTRAGSPSALKSSAVATAPPAPVCQAGHNGVNWSRPNNRSSMYRDRAICQPVDTLQGPSGQACGQEYISRAGRPTRPVAVRASTRNPARKEVEPTRRMDHRLRTA